MVVDALFKRRDMVHTLQSIEGSGRWFSKVEDDFRGMIVLKAGGCECM